VYETFSKRRRNREREGQPIIYQYEILPKAFRFQVVHIWRGALGSAEHLASSNVYHTPWHTLWRVIHDTIAREYGILDLAPDWPSYPDKCEEFLLHALTEGALDIIEFSFHKIDTDLRTQDPTSSSKIYVDQDPDDAILELNYRLREHSIGYQFAGGQLIRVDEQYLHENVVEPALALLHSTTFRGAEEEFLSAHEHYRKGQNKEAIVDALKSFESTLKSICDNHNWAYERGATASQLIKVILDEELVPQFLQDHFQGLRKVLEAGVPPIRNKTSAHGQGSKLILVPDYLAAYALHLAASNIVFLIEAHSNYKSSAS
jgi:hypothetical protein